MRNDYEKAVTETVVLYVQATIDATVLAAAPVVSFYDAMAQDDADRMVVICESGETKVGNPGNAVVSVEVGVKTQIAQPTMAADITAHFERVNCLRDIFNVSDPGGAITAYNVDGIVIESVEPERRFETAPDRESGFIYSSLELTMHIHTATEA